MKYTQIKEYIESLPNLRKIEVVFEDDEDMAGNFYVVKTKETYVYENEEDADSTVDDVRRDPGFAGVDKTDKPGKMNKAGEITKPETYVVKAKFNH